MLGTLPHDVDLRPQIDIVSGIRKSLRQFAETKENQEDLPDAVGSANALVTALTALIDKNPYPSFTFSEQVQLVYAAVLFSDRLSRNLGKIYSQVLEDKGGRSVKTLWTNPLKLMDSKVVPHLSDFVVVNIQEAAKCWVVDRPTATGFHMMRSVECVLRAYKKLVTGKNAQWTDNKGALRYDGFGSIIKDLNLELDALKKSHAQYGQLELVIGILQPLSKLYRDPLAHPELKELEQEDAKLAFEQGLSAIGRMVNDSLDGGTHFKIAFAVGAKF